MANYEYIAHHGIKGQKWGVRRYQNPDGSLKPAGRKRRSDGYHDDYKKVHDKKSVKYMSDKELNDRNKRLNAEKQYGQLMKKGNKGKAIVNAYIAGGTMLAGVVTATAAYAKYANKGIGKIGDWIVNSIDLRSPLTK